MKTKLDQHDLDDLAYEQEKDRRMFADYRPNERPWYARINPWLFAALCIALYALAVSLAATP